MRGLIDQVDQRREGAPVGNHNASKSTVDNVNSCIEPRPTGTSTDYALRRLRKDRPDLHQRVLNKELSPNAAMIEAGFRVKTFTLPATACAFHPRGGSIQIRTYARTI